MGLIGKEIVQSRVWIDPNAPDPPNLNYKETYPITVFDAIRRTLDTRSQNLTEVINNIEEKLKMTQYMLPDKPANNIVTYGGAPGSVGSIGISEKIPFDFKSQSHNKIPTEKAVGDLLLKCGLIDIDGNIDTSSKISWNNIIGRPTIYDELGDDPEGLINQKKLSELINSINSNISEIIEYSKLNILDLNDIVKNHLENNNNPHNITIEQIGAASDSVVAQHINDINNPHNITARTLGLGNVDNTSDEDKPISRAARDVLTNIERSLSILTNKVDTSQYITNLTYDQPTGRLTATYNDGSIFGVSIITDGLLDECIFDEENNILMFNELGGRILKVDLSKLYNQVIGVPSPTIEFEVDGRSLKANVVEKGITHNEIADNTIIDENVAFDSINGDKMKPFSITGDRIASKTITGECVADYGLKSGNYGTRSVDGRALFSSSTDSRVLITKRAGNNPYWGQVDADMLATSSVDSRHLIDRAITESKLGEYCVSDDKIKNNTITSRKLADCTIQNDKIANNTICGDKISRSLILQGNPKLETRPNTNTIDNSIVDAKWVYDFINNGSIHTDGLVDRAVTGDKLFSSAIKNRALVVLETNQSAVWGLINNGMMDIDSVDTDNIKDLSVSADKLKDGAVTSRALARNSVTKGKLDIGAVRPENIESYYVPNRVIAVLREDTPPVYTQINAEMMAHNSVTDWQIQDEAVTMSKIIHSEHPNMIMAVTLSSQDPFWSKLQTEMIENYAVTSEKIYRSPEANRILAVRESNTSPTYMKLETDMIKDGAIVNKSIADDAITSRKIAIYTIEKDHIKDNAIMDYHIAESQISGRELFKSKSKNKILATETEDGKASWTTLKSNMIDDHEIQGSKLFSSEYGYTVLGVSSPNGDVEHLKITGDFVKDKSIVSSNLSDNIQLSGVPSLEHHPDMNSNDYSIADTYYVNKKIEDFNISGTISSIPTNSISPDKLLKGNKDTVLGINSESGIPGYVKVNQNMILNGSITNDKIQRNLTLFGSPSIEVRPSPHSSDENDNGDLIPDCQWVLDRIADENSNFLDYLKKYIGCLNAPDPYLHGFNCVSAIPISDKYIDLCLEGEGSPKETDFAFISPRSKQIGPIDIDTVDLLLDNDDVEECKSKNVMVDNKMISYITDDELDELLEDNSDAVYSFNDELFIHVDKHHGCCHGPVRYKYLYPITPRTIDKILDGTAMATHTIPLRFEKRNMEIVSIGKKIIYRLIDDEELFSEHFEEFEVENFREDVVSPITEQMLDAIFFTDEVFELSECIDFTDYPERDRYNTGGGGAELLPGSVLTEYIQDRAITGSKIFTSDVENTVLSVVSPNSDPIWTKITGAMIEDKTITTNLLHSSYRDYRVLGVYRAGDEPTWTLIGNKFLEDNCIESWNLVNGSVITSKISDYNITASKLARETMIMTLHIYDEAVTNRKIADNSISTKKIIDRNITGEKIARDQIIPIRTTVEECLSYTDRSLRNTIISNNIPSDCKNGDIWFMYA